MSRYYDKRGNPIDLLTWAKLFEDNDYRRVAYDKIDNILVTTIWLGLDHNFAPNCCKLIFETMIGDVATGEWIDQSRYETFAEALAGHFRCVSELWAKSTTDSCCGNNSTGLAVSGIRLAFC